MVAHISVHHAHRSVRLGGHRKVLLERHVHQPVQDVQDAKRHREAHTGRSIDQRHTVDVASPSRALLGRLALPLAPELIVAQHAQPDLLPFGLARHLRLRGALHRRHARRGRRHGRHGGGGGRIIATRADADAGVMVEAGVLVLDCIGRNRRGLRFKKKTIMGWDVDEPVFFELATNG